MGKDLGMNIEKVTETLEAYKRYGSIQKENLEKMKRTFDSYMLSYQSSKNNENMLKIQNKMIKDYTELIENIDLEIAEIEKQIEHYKKTNQAATTTVKIASEE